MWSTWKKRRQPSAVFVLKAEWTPRITCHLTKILYLMHNTHVLVVAILDFWHLAVRVTEYEQSNVRFGICSPENH